LFGGLKKIITFVMYLKRNIMGTYIYTYKKKFDKNATLNGDKVVVGQATFICRQDWSDNYSPSEKREMTRAYALTKNDQPEYITFDDEMVYKNNKKGVWSDGSGFWGGIDHKNDFVGTLKKVGKKYIIEK
jgi:hypothetical protein